MLRTPVLEVSALSNISDNADKKNLTSFIILTDLATFLNSLVPEFFSNDRYHGGDFETLGQSQWENYQIFTPAVLGK